MIEPSIEELILSGAVEVSGVDSNTGEFLYTFTEKFRDVLPEIYNHRMAFIQQEVMYFYEIGLLDINDPLSPNPVISLTELAFDQEILDDLPEEKKESLEELKRLFEK